MRYITIKTPHEEVKVSRIGIGSAMSMMSLTPDEVARIYDVYVEAGGNYIDTARAYGDGACEEMVARYIRNSGKRNELLLCTKGCHPRYGDQGDSRLSAADMREDIDASLKAFGVDAFDIYWIHKDDESIPVEQIVDDMNACIVKPGKARILGCSNWHTHRMEAANQYARESNQSGFAVSQIQWSLAETKEEYFREHGAVVMDDASYDWYLKQQIPVFAFSSQAQGFFAKLDAASGDLSRLRENLVTWYGTKENLARYEKVKAYAAEHHVSIPAAGLGYLVCNKLPCVPIIGATNPQMLALSMEAASLSMTAEEADALYQV